MDIQQIFFTNLQLLGFDAFTMERKWRIPFNKEMFQLPNKKGFEAVAHFLFEKLNPTQCREQFRDCWPVTDKKQEQDFRRVVNHWLTDIAKEPDSHFPRIVASVFLSPGGDKFYQLIFALSRYVLYKNITHETGYKQNDFLRHPVMTPNNQSMGTVLVQALQCGVVRHRKQSLEHMQQAAVMQEQWKQFASELVKTHRSINKTIRDLERELKIEAQKSLEIRSPSGSQVSHRRKSGVTGYDQDVQNIIRAQKVQEVRELWKLIDNFSVTKATERQIMESILSGTLDNYKISGTDLNVRVPDLLLRECEKEIQRRGVENIYEGGKLNLLSLIHLWNLSLHLYIEKLHQAGVPDFEKDIPTINTQVHTHHAHLTSAQTLRSKLEKETIPELKQNIKKLKQDLDQRVFTNISPNSVRTTSLGFGLMPPTPPVSFDPSDAKTPSNMAVNMKTELKSDPVNTPEAALQLMDSINKRVISSQSASPLVQGVPIYAPRQELAAKQRLPTSQYLRPLNMSIAELEAREARHSDPPKQYVHRVRFSVNPEYISLHKVDKRSPLGDGAELEKRGQKQSTRFKSTASSRIHKPCGSLSGVRNKREGESIKKTPSGTTLTKHDIKSEAFAKKNLSSQITGPGPITDEEIFRHSTDKYTHQQRPVTPVLQPVVEKHLDSSVLSSIPRSPTDAHEILAERLVDDIMSSGSSPREVLGQAGSDEDILAKDAFVKKDKLVRTPPQKERWHDNLLENSYGPLSSTRIDQSKAPTERGNRDKVATKLFCPEEIDDHDIHNLIGGQQQTQRQTITITDQVINTKSQVVLPSSVRQETYGAELDEQPATINDLGDFQSSYNVPVSNRPQSSLGIEIPNNNNIHKYKTKAVADLESNTPKGEQDDPYRELSIKFSLLSPNVSGIGELSSSVGRKTPDLEDIQKRLTFHTDVTESYKHLSETATPILPVRQRDRINKQLDLESTKSPKQSDNSSYIPIESFKNSKSSNSDNFLVTFGTPPDIDPTPSNLENERGLRAVDVLSMSPTKGGGAEYNLGIFDLNLDGDKTCTFTNNDLIHGSVGDSKSSSQKEKSIFQLDLDIDQEDQAEDHVKWRDLEQEIRNADSQLTSITSDIVQDNVRVIEFQNGSFKEFLEKSPDKITKVGAKLSLDDSTSESSDAALNERKMLSTSKENSPLHTRYMEKNTSSLYDNKSSSVFIKDNKQEESALETDSVIARYKKLKILQQQSGLPNESDTYHSSAGIRSSTTVGNNCSPSTLENKLTKSVDYNQGSGATVVMDMLPPTMSQTYQQEQLGLLASPLQTLQASINDEDNNLITHSPFSAIGTSSYSVSPQVNTSLDLFSDKNRSLIQDGQSSLDQQLSLQGRYKTKKFSLNDFEFDNGTPLKQSALLNDSNSAMSSIDDIFGTGLLGEGFSKTAGALSEWNYRPSEIGHTKQEKGQLELKTLTVSPLTNALHLPFESSHRTITKGVKISPEKFPDIFGEDESLLVPPSPP